LRDLLIATIIFGMIPVVVARPWIGAIMFVWVSLMTPQRFAFGFAYDFPFAAVIAVCTLFGVLLTRDELRYDLNVVLFLMILLPFWMCVTYAFSLERESGYGRWVEVMKIFFFLHVSALVLRTRKHIEWLLWVIVVSVGFFGVKGGLFTIMSGGSGRVYGPPGDSFMSDNNAISVALVMVIPLMYYLRSVASSQWVRYGLLMAMALSGVAVLGSYSRGALVAVSAMLLFLFFKSHSKLLFAATLAALVPIAIGVMPSTWTDRMNSISNYEHDSSAMGRINAWQTAINVANDRPLVGGGFEMYSPATFARYAPDPTDVHAAHSVYFQMLGEHGYVGLLLFLALGVAAWFTARRLIRSASATPDSRWAGQLARSIQASLVGFAVGGAFVNIGYWEPPYYEILILLVAYKEVTTNRQAAASVPTVDIASEGSAMTSAGVRVPSDSR
jgi:probable O-glycosylation ligase (exosortase A-associated)